MPNAVLGTGSDGNPVFHCPGCKQGHKVWVKTINEISGAAWTWNNDLVRPTFKPSIMVKRHHVEEIFVCHSIVTDGQIAFCADSTHELSGKTVPLEPFE